MLIEYWLLVCCCCFNKFLLSINSDSLQWNNFRLHMHYDFIFFSTRCVHMYVYLTHFVFSYSQFQFSCSFRFVDAWLCVCSYCSAGAHKFLYTCTLAVHSKFCRNPGHPSKVVQRGKLCIFVVIWCHLFTILHNWCSVYHCSFSFTVGKYMYNTFKKML